MENLISDNIKTLFNKIQDDSELEVMFNNYKKDNILNLHNYIDHLVVKFVLPYIYIYLDNYFNYNKKFLEHIKYHLHTKMAGLIIYLYVCCL